MAIEITFYFVKKEQSDRMAIVINGLFTFNMDTEFVGNT